MFYIFYTAPFSACDKAQIVSSAVMWLIQPAALFVSNFVYLAVKYIIFFECRVHKPQVGFTDNRRSLKIHSRKMNFWVAENKIYCRRKPTSLAVCWWCQLL